MSGRASELLGYPRDARLLILNADDLGMHPGVNQAVADAVERGAIGSTSLIVPSPWAGEAMRWASRHPELSLGIHLTLVNDLRMRWRPCCPPEQVPSLVGPDGAFRPLERLEETLSLARPEEAKAEFRAQLQAVLAAGLQPTHLDWHCLYSGGRPALFRVTFELAREYGLAVRVADAPWIDLLQGADLVTDDHPLLDSYEVPVAEKPGVYDRMLRGLPPGLTQWAMHPGRGDERARALDPDGLEIRRTDLDWLLSPETARVLREERIVRVEYRDVQRAWQQRGFPARAPSLVEG